MAHLITNKQPRFAFPIRPFRMYLGGSFIASIGDWMDMVALNWAVLQMTGSPVHLGIINACRLIPIFLLSVPAGILADRFDRRKLLSVIQTVVMLLSFLIGYLLFQGAPFWLFAAVVTLRSVFMAMDPPIRNSMIPNLVSKPNIGRAIAMNTAGLNLSRIIGPAIAGVLLTMVDVHDVIWIAAWALLIEVAMLYVLRPVTEQERTAKGEVKEDVREAVSYIKKAPNVQSLLLLAVVPMVFGFPYTSMMPVFVTELQHMGPEGLGALLSFSAGGAVLGSMWLSVRREQRHAGRLLVLSLLGFGASLLLFMFAGSFLAAAALMFLVGLFSQTYRTMSRMTIQTQVPDELRGRIMSIALMDRGFIPLGALVIGTVAATTGALWAGVMMGSGCILITLAVLGSRRQIWNI